MKSCGIRLFLLGLLLGAQLAFPFAEPAQSAAQSSGVAPAATTSQGLAFAGRIGAMPRTIATNGTYLFAGQDSELTILDVGNPAAPSLVGKIAVTGAITKLVVAGSRLYVAAGKLYVLDITHPAAPAVLGSIGLGGNLEDLTLAGSDAYVISEAGLKIVDLANPAAPSLVGSYSSQYVLNTVALSGQYAYLKATDPLTPRQAYLEIVALADPARPTLARRDATFGFFIEMALFGSHGLVARGVDGLDLISVASPLAPAVVAHRAAFAPSISAVGSRAYVAITGPSAPGLRIFDISNPPSLVEQGFYPSAGTIMRLTGTGRYVYLFDAQEGYSIIDALNPAAPTRTGLLREVISPERLVVQGSYAYVIDGQPNGLKIVDISDISNAVVVGMYYPPNTKVSSLAIAGNYAYIGTQTNVLTETGTLNIVNIADPAHPVEVAVYKIPGATWIAIGPIVILGHYAYVGDHTKLHVVDIADPAHPQLVGSYAPAQAVINCMAGENGYMYLGLSRGSVLDRSALEIIDVSNPAAPAKAGSIATQDDSAIDVAVAGQYAYMVSGLPSERGGLNAIDISDPTNPKLAGRLNVDAPGQVAITANTAYLTHQFVNPGGVSVLDIGDPDPMRQTGFYGATVAGDVALSGEFVLITAGGNGLIILKAVTLTTRAFIPLIE
ncbi:MAG TPA: hypothetical protein VFU22_32765 [Roseiflexaceae bacterium]|nr:hypothetical protein [Roseiflexaceae bacterium]